MYEISTDIQGRAHSFAFLLRSPTRVNDAIVLEKDTLVQVDVNSKTELVDILFVPSSFFSPKCALVWNNSSSTTLSLRMRVVDSVFLEQNVPGKGWVCIGFDHIQHAIHTRNGICSLIRTFKAFINHAGNKSSTSSKTKKEIINPRGNNVCFFAPFPTPDDKEMYTMWGVDDITDRVVSEGMNCKLCCKI